MDYFNNYFVKGEIIMAINPVKRELVVSKDIQTTRSELVKQLRSMKGKIVTSEEDFIECDFGSLFRARFFGELFVNKKTLPRKALINLKEVSNNKTRVKIFIKDTHKYGIKIGYNNKYEAALREDLGSIVSVLE